MKREILRATVRDLVAKLLYYDRKEDEDLPVGEIERMIRDGELTSYELIAWFADDLRKAVFEDR